jgi:hypothetical protein
MEPPYTQEEPMSDPMSESDEEYVPPSQGSVSSDGSPGQPLVPDDEDALVEAQAIQRRKKAHAKKKKDRRVVKLEPRESSSVLTAEESPQHKRKRVKREKRIKREKHEKPVKKEPTPESESTQDVPTPPKREPKPKLKRVKCVLEEDEDTSTTGHTMSMASRTMSMGPQRGSLVIDLSGEDTDPVAAHVTMNRVCSTVHARAAATKDVVTALEVMSACQIKVGESVLAGFKVEGSSARHVGSQQVRTVLRRLVDMDSQYTSVGTRRAARELIALDGRIAKAVGTLVESLRVNPLARDEMYERFLREDDCPICQHAFPDPHTRELHVLRFNCDHAVHTQCMADWQRSSPGSTAQCPICRANNRHSGVDDGYTLMDPLGPGYTAWDDELDGDDMRALETDRSDDGDDGAFRAKVCTETAVAGTRVTRARARDNERRGAPYFSER